MGIYSVFGSSKRFTITLKCGAHKTKQKKTKKKELKKNNKA